VNRTLQTLVLFEVTLAFIVHCADEAGEDEDRPRRAILTQVVRSVFWMITLTRWFTYRNLSKLSRFATIVWFLVTSGWLLTLIHDRAASAGVFLAGAEGVMAFVVLCVDTMSADLRLHPARRAVRSLVWPKALAGYMVDRDSVRIIQASVTVWILLTTGWLLALEADRIARPLWSPAS
jgi:hypothetical protein